MAVDLHEPDTRLAGSETAQLLTSVEVARFVAQGFLRFDGIVPEEINDPASDQLSAGLDPVAYGSSVVEAFGPDTLGHQLLQLPQVAGAVYRLLGPDPTIDHHAIHVRKPHEGEAQDMHGDAIIDVRTGVFDIQLMYYPREVTLDMGGTLSVPGTHLRRINETDIGRYQNLKGPTRLTCPAGTVVLLHHGIWHSGRRNDSDISRSMYKIRFNPTVKQRLWWDTADLQSPQVAKELGARHPWMENASGRLEIFNRVLLWRELTGDEDFDIDWWVTRVRNNPAAADPS